MYSAALAFGVALVVALAVTPLVRLIALRTGVTDTPGGRRVHTRTIPRLGGVAVLVAFFVALLVLFGVQTSAARIFYSSPLLTLGLAGGGLIVALMGFLDDVVGLRARHKILAQVGAAALAVMCGFRVEGFSLSSIGWVDLGLLSVPVTIVWIVGITNAVNLIDGLDGLAAGTTLLAAIANFVVASMVGNPLIMLASAALVGALLGFLMFNFNPASIFLGDTGSMFLGYALATISLMGNTQETTTAISALVPIVLLGLPISDTVSAIVRRRMRGQPFWAADKAHIHHQLLELGVSHRHAVLVLYTVSLLLGGAAVLLVIGSQLATIGAISSIVLVMIAFVYLRRRHAQKQSSSYPARELFEPIAALMEELSKCGSDEQLRHSWQRFCERLGTSIRVSVDGALWCELLPAASSKPELYVQRVSCEGALLELPFAVEPRIEGALCLAVSFTRRARVVSRPPKRVSDSVVTRIPMSSSA